MAYYRTNNPVAVNINMVDSSGRAVLGLISPNIALTLIKEGINQTVTGLYSISEQQKGIYRVVFNSSLMQTADVDYVLIAQDNTGVAVDDKAEFTLYSETVDTVYTNLKTEIDVNESKIDVITSYIEEVEPLLKNTTYGLSAIKTGVNNLSTQVSTSQTTVVNEVQTQANENEVKIDSVVSQITTVSNKVDINTSKLNTIEGYTDEVEALLKNTTYGLEVIKNKVNDIDTNASVNKTTLQNEIITQANENEAKLDTIISNQSSSLSSLLTAVQTNTNHLLAVRDYVDELESLVKNTTYGLEAIKNKANELDINLAVVKVALQAEIITQANENEVKIDSVSSSVSSAINEINGNEAKLDVIISYTDEVEGLLKSATYGLNALKTKLDSMEVQAAVDKVVVTNEVISQANQNETKIDTVITTLASMESNLITEVNQIPINPLLSTDSRADRLNYLDTTVSSIPLSSAQRTWAYPSRYLSGTSGVNQIDITGFDSGFAVGNDVHVNVDLFDTTGGYVVGKVYPTNLNVKLYKGGYDTSTAGYVSVGETYPGNYRVTVNGYLIDTPAIDYLLVLYDTSSNVGKVEFTAFDIIGVAGPRTVSIYTMDAYTLLPIPDAQVYVQNSAQSLIINKGITGENGRYQTGLTDGSYNVILRKSFVDFEVPQVLSVFGDTTAIYYGTSFSPTSPISPDTCQIYGWVADLSGGGIRNAKVIATETQSARYAGVYKIGKLTKQTLTDNNGYWEIELVRSSQLTPSGVKYKLEITYPGFQYSKDILVPDSSSIEFSGL